MEGGNAIAEAVENKTNLDVLELDGLLLVDLK